MCAQCETARAVTKDGLLLRYSDRPTGRDRALHHEPVRRCIPCAQLKVVDRPRRFQLNRGERLETAIDEQLHLRRGGIGIAQVKAAQDGLIEFGVTANFGKLGERILFFAFGRANRVIVGVTKKERREPVEENIFQLRRRQGDVRRRGRRRGSSN